MEKNISDMSEVEKIGAGLEFSLVAPELLARRPIVKEKLDRINYGKWENPEERIEYLKSVFGALGDCPYILEPVCFVAGRNIFLGDNVFINSNVTFIDSMPIEVGSHTMIAPGCVITTVDHPKSPKARRNFTSVAAPVKIGRDVWIGANCTVFPGVTIGDNVIVGANSVVNSDIPSNSVAVGSPARVIRKIEDDTDDARDLNQES